MNMKYKLSICSIVSILFTYLLPNQTWATLLSDALTDKGIDYYYEGQYDEAIHELSKALLADPDDKRALKYLQLMGLSWGAYGPGETLIERTGALADQVVAYRHALADKESEIDFFEQKNQSLKNQLQGSWHSIKRQQQIKDRLNQAIRAKERDLREKQHDLHRMSSILSEKQGDVARLNADLYDLSDYAQKQQQVLEKATTRLADVSENYQYSLRRWQKESYEYQDLITEMEHQANRQKNDFLDDEQVDRQYIKSLRHNLRAVSDQKKDALGQLRLISRKLSKLEEQIKKKDYTLSILKKAILSLRSDMDALNITDSSDHLRPDLLPGAGQRDHREIRWIERKDDLVDDIKRRIDQTRAQMDTVSLGSDEEETDSLLSLRQQLEQTEAELEQTRAAMDEKDSGYTALEQRLQDTQERLGIVEEMLKEKEAQIQTLEKQLTDYLSLDEK